MYEFLSTPYGAAIAAIILTMPVWWLAVVQIRLDWLRTEVRERMYTEMEVAQLVTAARRAIQGTTTKTHTQVLPPKGGSAAAPKGASR